MVAECTRNRERLASACRVYNEAYGGRCEFGDRGTDGLLMGILGRMRRLESSIAALGPVKTPGASR